ncbi:hypothetical protein AYX13_07020 [Cryptococcus neoformans]|nr:hypothetical protein AYX13_07020 [Cryptococcus neoformans var. grubii]
MADSMTLAHEHKINNPRESYQKVADLYEVLKPSLYDRHTGVHSSHTTSAPRRPSIVQEEELVNKINGYAERSTLLTPRHAVECAEAVDGGEIGVKLGSRSKMCTILASRPPTLSSAWTELLSSSQALEECEELRLVPI